MFQVPESNTLPIPPNLFLRDQLRVLKQKSFLKIDFYLSQEFYFLSNNAMPSFLQLGMQCMQSRSKPGLAWRGTALELSPGGRGGTERREEGFESQPHRSHLRSLPAGPRALPWCSRPGESAGICKSH